MDLGRQDACWKEMGELMALGIFPFSKGQGRGAAGDLVALAVRLVALGDKGQQMTALGHS